MHRTSRLPHPRGVAATQRLLVDGTSSLYEPGENRLCEELHRIRLLLGS